MKLRHTNQIELSYANAKALVAEYERKLAKGMRPDALIYRTVRDEASGDNVVVAVSIVPDEDHYTPEELEERRSPYLPPEAWAGI